MTETRPRPTWIQVFLGLFGVAALVLAAWCTVFVVRGLLSTDPLEAFVTRFPGAAPLPADTAEGIPAFVSWTHFLNAFFLVLIIRTGIRVRTEKRAGGLWTSNRVKKRRMSLALWGHLAVDVLWLANGLVFVVLLFASGHWVRIVPTSWEVFPNALSTLVQYVSLDWPTEDSWVNYNALQQLSYCAIVFVAAPLAAVTGYRLSAFWPQKWSWFSEHTAKRIHFPTMLFFVAFVITHVGLVFATGALRNLGHMYAGTDEVSWTGFWIFAATVVLMVIGWRAARRDDWIAKPAAWTGSVRMMKR
ncbi:cytochrome b/b6 domain-containing protein [Microbacterium sp. G2-8]|uniref:cytochrome b/b6 domain-containing protein n=1 Tax=Microbacterium sp. G2-8 TaxID=2842454 RepID=UPI0027E257BB|nr:cytochrome b/b6 domain-containing protein [Microbacterium sp. G2-8]